MISENRDRVIENIKICAQSGRWNSKVEVDDPNLTADEKQQLMDRWKKNRKTLRYRIRNCVARCMVNALTYVENKSTEIVGLEHIKDIEGGAIVTSNHFNPMDNTAVRKMIQKAGRKRLYIVSQETNLAMKGLLGFYMNYTDIIPITSDGSYMKKDFYHMLKEQMKKGQYVLIYPEQEMWFNYRKPRPPKRGAYYYAAKLQVPVISCFVEMRELPEKEKNTEEFYKIRYIVHVLEPIWPDSKKSVRENSIIMMNRDYEQKKAAYERAYGKPLTYEFCEEDIAGRVLRRYTSEG